MKYISVTNVITCKGDITKDFELVMHEAMAFAKLVQTRVVVEYKGKYYKITKITVLSDLLKEYKENQKEYKENKGD